MSEDRFENLEGNATESDSSDGSVKSRESKIEQLERQLGRVQRKDKIKKQKLAEMMGGNLKSSLSSSDDDYATTKHLSVTDLIAYRSSKSIRKKKL